MSNKKFQIEIIHVPTYDNSPGSPDASGSYVTFEPYLDNFSDNFKSTWSTKQVIGRMDDIATFVQTKRTINIDFIVPSSNRLEGKENYEKSIKLSKFLYPIYKTTKTVKPDSVSIPSIDNGANVNANVRNFYNLIKLSTTLEENLNLRDEVSIMSAAPIIRIKFSNLINGPDGNGLYGYLDGYNFTPSKDSGYYLDADENTIIPKEFKISLTFNVIHDYKLGWNIDNKWRG